MGVRERIAKYIGRSKWIGLSFFWVSLKVYDWLGVEILLIRKFGISQTSVKLDRTCLLFVNNCLSRINMLKRDDDEDG